jgi:hypothetical protein
MIIVGKFCGFELSEDHLNSETLIMMTLDLGRCYERIAVFRPIPPLGFFPRSVGWAACAPSHENGSKAA